MRQQGDRLRRAVRKLHLWLGLWLGGLFVLLGLTASLLVFYPQVDAMLHPELRAEGEGEPDWDRALATVRAAYPDKQGGWRFEVTGEPGAIPARYYDPPERAVHAFRPMMVWLSPDGGRVLRRDYWGEYAMTFIYDLHYRLTLGEAGRQDRRMVGVWPARFAAERVVGVVAQRWSGGSGPRRCGSSAARTVAGVARLAQAGGAGGIAVPAAADRHRNHAGPAG